jgi:NADH-quinone oxidoreductase subunit M
MILAPLVAALVLCFVPRNLGFLMQIVAVLATFVTMVIAIGMFWFYGSAAVSAGGFRYEYIQEWVPALGISYHVGVDGLNVGLVLMGAIVAFAAAWCGWEIHEREKEFYILLLVMTGGILWAFSSLDLFFFYFAHELALVPTFIMIGVWGRGPDRNYATFQITLYLSLGALIALIGLIALYLQAGAHTFDMVQLLGRRQGNPLSLQAQNSIFPLLLFGFGILISLWPFHTWAPAGYGSAPTPTAMLHAGVLKKFGLYGLIRIALPLLPDATRNWAHVIAWLCLGNILYCGLVATRQKKFNWLVGYSSVAHMGFVFLGIASLSVVGVTGAVLVMIAHGLLAALTFGLSGYLYHTTGTLEMRELGGLLRKLPFLGTVLIMAMFAGCGLPGFANFAGEMAVFFGAWKTFPLVTGVAVWASLVIGAVYMLRAIRAMLHGPVPERWAGVTESSWPFRKVPYLVLLAGLLIFGFFPGPLAKRISDAVVLILPASAPAAGVMASGGETAQVADAGPAGTGSVK